MKRIDLKTKYSQERGAIITRSYYPADGSTALEIKSAFGEPLITPTVCLVAYAEKPSAGNVFIKNWSENEGILKCLQDQGIIGDVIRTVPAGYTEAHECKLLVEL